MLEFYKEGSENPFSKLIRKLQLLIINNREASTLMPPAIITFSIVVFSLPAVSQGVKVFIIPIVLCLLTLQFWVHFVIRKFGNFGRIYSAFGSNVHIVTSHALAIEENISVTPAFEEWACDRLTQSMSRWGKLTKKFIDTDKECPPNWDGDFIVIGGPARNSKSLLLSIEMGTKVPGAFFFADAGGGPADPGNGYQKPWIITNSALDEIEVKYAGLAMDGADRDHGIIYVGPNPLNPDRRIIWIAGLAPYSTWGAARIITEMTRASHIGDQLDTSRSYCSVLFKVKFHSADKDDIRDLSIEHMVLSRGELGVPTIGLDRPRLDSKKFVSADTEAGVVDFSRK